MPDSPPAAGAVAAPNLSVDVNGRRLAYRSIGSGRPIVLCTRFRGNLDLWDPAFLDALAANGFRVVTFDYTGLGLSTGAATYDVPALANDARDLIEALGLHDVIIAGWSIGGMAAQVAVAVYPDVITHVVLLATTPPGPLVKTAEQLFFEIAAKPVHAFEDNVVVFFEPESKLSREAAARSEERIAARTTDRSAPVPADWAAAALGDTPRNPMFPADGLLQLLKTTTIPILHIGGDHDIIFPVENWYALSEQLPTLQLLTFPRTGHGPQHQHPEACAAHIATFVGTT